MAMKEFVISEAQAETAVLVGLITQTQLAINMKFLPNMKTK